MITALENGVSDEPFTIKITGFGLNRVLSKVYLIPTVVVVMLIGTFCRSVTPR